MPTIGSVTKTIRISPRDLEVIEGLMADGTSWSGAIHKLCSENRGSKVGTPSKKGEKSVLTHDKWKINEKDLEDLNTMASFMGGSVSEMIRLFDEAVNEGALEYDGEKYVGVPDIDLDRFKDACHDINTDPQEMLDKVTGMIEKGRI